MSSDVPSVCVDISPRADEASVPILPSAWPLGFPSLTLLWACNLQFSIDRHLPLQEAVVPGLSLDPSAALLE
jgi:hypothetical protein